MGGDEVDALVRAARFMEAVRKQVVAAVDPLHQGAHLARLAPHERTHIVAKLAVPLKPADAREPASELIAADIPGFGHEPDVEQVPEQADLGHHGGLVNVHRAIGGA